MRALRVSGDESGFSTAWILGLVLVILMLGATFYDIGQVLVERQKLVTAADRAANAGAMAIDEDNLINNPSDPIQLLDDGSDASAPARCNRAFESEKSKLAGSVKNVQYTCTVEGEYMVAHIQGDVSFGSIASLLNVEPKTFNVTSRSKPTCSQDAADSTAEDC